MGACRSEIPEAESTSPSAAHSQNFLRQHIVDYWNPEYISDLVRLPSPLRFGGLTLSLPLPSRIIYGSPQPSASISPFSPTTHYRSCPQNITCASASGLPSLKTGLKRRSNQMNQFPVIPSSN
ncbi:hypothetical protein BDW75DRAFT_135500 [Aspergillus navahoensis]